MADSPALRCRQERADAAAPKKAAQGNLAPSAEATACLTADGAAPRVPQIAVTRLAALGPSTLKCANLSVAAWLLTSFSC
jgi:hypothetical protein